jgi:two-component system response regulator AtoC
MTNDHILKVFVVDDDEFFGTIVKSKLEHEDNIDVTLFDNATDFLQSMHEHPDLVIIDYDLPDMNGIEILKKVNEFDPEIISLILSGQKDVTVVVDAYKNGTDKYIIKDENALIEMMYSVNNFRKSIQLKQDFLALQNAVIENNTYSNIIGKSSAMQKLFHLMSKVENINIPVLITGENGTGKELVANALHYNSNRKRQRFIAINVAAIPEDLIESELFGSEKGAFTGASRRSGKFEEAHKGTIFLDEIGEMPLGLQAKLLRVLQESKVTRLGGSKEIPLDIKVISATNKDLWKEVQAGRFREDLYFRLQGFIIQIPSLRDRENDILLIAKHVFEKFCASQRIETKSLSANAAKSLMEYNWPGNVRELKSMIERAILISDSKLILAEDLVFLDSIRA